MPSRYTAVVAGLIAAVTQATQVLQAEAEAQEIVATVELDKMNMIGLAVLYSAGLPMEAGTKLRFKIGGNPTTGYEWFADEEAADGAFTIEKEYLMDTPGPECIVEGENLCTGIGGNYYFTITAVDEGPAEGVLSLIYGRSWDTENSALKSHDIPIHVV